MFSIIFRFKISGLSLETENHLKLSVIQSYDLAFPPLIIRGGVRGVVFLCFRLVWRGVVDFFSAVVILFLSLLLLILFCIFWEKNLPCVFRYRVYSEQEKILRCVSQGAFSPLSFFAFFIYNSSTTLWRRVAAKC